MPAPTRRESACHRATRALSCALALLLGPAAAAAAEPASLRALADMSIEDLLDVEITTASKKSEQLASVPAAIYVITAEEIAHASATTIADLLRMVPGLEVASIDGNKWAVSARGSNERFARRLLVLLDGRTLYSPIYSGVFWDVQDIVLDDIDRIEVIRGPGGSVWGANAVNGVINIITRKAADTRGAYARAEISDGADQIYAARYGGAKEGLLDYRVSLKLRDHPDSDVTADGHDGWNMARLDARTDWHLADGSTLTVSGELYDGTVQSRQPLVLLTPPYGTIENADDDVSGAHLLARWDSSPARPVRWSVQGYWDNTSRELLGAELRTDVFDLELQSELPLTPATQIVAGLGYRAILDNPGESEILLFRESAERDILSAFAQLDQELFATGARLVLGTKVEHNDYTGTEVQPSARLLVPVGRFNLWAAASRAVRTPASGELNAITPLSVIPPGTPQNPSFLPVLVQFEGANELDAEVVHAFEAGLRGRLTNTLWIDIAVFYNEYDKVVDTLLGTPRPEPFAPVPRTVLPVRIGNGAEAEAQGFEVLLDWEAGAGARLRGFYGYLDESRDVVGLTALQGASAPRGEVAPLHQAGLRLATSPLEGVDLTVMAKYVAPLERLRIKDYVDLDFKIAWHLGERLTLMMAADSLIDAPRQEFRSSELPLSETRVERALYGGLEVRF